jgi:hypothetical protein
LITVNADGQAGLIHLGSVIQDGTLGESIITQDAANQTRGNKRSITPTVLTDDTGRKYTSQACIDLKWYPRNTHMSAITNKETFYIVEDCGDHDAILREGCLGPLDSSAKLRSDVLVLDRRTEGTATSQPR